MPNKFTSERELLESIKKVSLSSQEKSSVKNSILSYIDSNPISPNVLIQKDKKKSVYDFFAYQSLYLVPLALFFILILNKDDGLVQNKNLPAGSTAPEEMNLDSGIQTFSTVSSQPNLQIELTDVKAQPEPPKATNRQVGNFSAQQGTTSQVMLIKSAPTTEVATSTESKKVEIKKETTTDKIMKQIDGGYKAIIETIFGKTKKEIKQEIAKEKKAKRTAKIKEVKNKKIESAKKSVSEPIKVKESSEEVIVDTTASTTATTTPETSSATSSQIKIEVSI